MHLREGAHNGRPNPSACCSWSAAQPLRAERAVEATPVDSRLHPSSSPSSSLPLWFTNNDGTSPRQKLGPTAPQVASGVKSVHCNAAHVEDDHELTGTGRDAVTPVTQRPAPALTKRVIQRVITRSSASSAQLKVPHHELTASAPDSSGTWPGLPRAWRCSRAASAGWPSRRSGTGRLMDDRASSVASAPGSWI